MTARTLTDLLALPAGDVLDDTILELKYAEHFESGFYVKDGPGLYHAMMNGKPMPMMRPLYSRREGDAWPLLAELLAAGVRITMRTHYSGLILEGSNASYGNKLFEVPSLSDAPLAICRAWATWVYGKRGEA